MSLIPWKKWFYPNIDKYKHELNDLENRYNQQRYQAQTAHNDFTTVLGQYKSMIAYDSALFITATVAVMRDDQFEQYEKSVSAGLGRAPEAPVPAECAGNIAEAYGSYKILGAVYQLGKLAKESWFASSAEELGAEAVEDAAALGGDAAAVGIGESAGIAAGEATGEAIGEIAGEVAAEGAAEGVLASTGVGVVAAVGIDAIIGAIEGAKEQSDLKDAVNKAHKELDKIDVYIAKVKKGEKQLYKGIIEQQKRFIRIMKQLRHIEEPRFKMDWHVQVENTGNFIAAMQSAVQQYGFLVTIRNDWHNYRLHKPDLNWETFVGIEIMKRPHRMSEEMARALFSAVEQNMAQPA